MSTGRFDGLELGWTERPGRMPPVLFLHCTLASRGAWRGVIGALPEDLASVAVDLPGHGEGGLDPDRGVLEQAAAGSAALMAGQAGPAGYHVVGHSLGAVAALKMALTRPGEVRSLTLFEPVLFGLLDDAGDPQWPDELSVREGIASAWDGGPRAALKAFLGRWGNGESLDDLPQVQQDRLVRLMHVVPLSDRDIYFDGPDRIYAADLARITCPVGLIRGSKSPSVIARIHDVIAGRVDCRFNDVIAGAGHMGPITHPTDFAARIARILAL